VNIFETEFFTVNEELHERVVAASKKALKKWEDEGAVFGLMEEMAELNLELSRIRRGRHNPDDVLEELVDVYMCMIELAMIFGRDKFNSMLEKKIAKFEEQVKDEEEWT
jgi:hypothetical protein